jgi:hypothetical protein
MGGSRRRNVPDQMEQPMMRNEHIVRAHQTPLVAINGDNGNEPWRVIHVNNQAAPGGDGSATDPFTTIAQGNAAATQAWDIVLVDPGALDPAARIAYGGTFSPLAANQYFLGNGDFFPIPTTNCGFKVITDNSGARPLLTNPTGPSIVVTDGLYVNNFDIVGSEVGILGSGNLSSGDRGSHVRNVDIVGTQQPNQTGVYLPNTKGAIDFSNVNITNMTNGGFVVEGGEPVIDKAAIDRDVQGVGLVPLAQPAGIDRQRPVAREQPAQIGGQMRIGVKGVDQRVRMIQADGVDGLAAIGAHIDEHLARLRRPAAQKRKVRLERLAQGAAHQALGANLGFQKRRKPALKRADMSGYMHDGASMVEAGAARPGPMLGLARQARNRVSSSASLASHASASCAQTKTAVSCPVSIRPRRQKRANALSSDWARMATLHRAMP